MTNVQALLRRELNAYFASVLGYIVMMFFSGGNGRQLYFRSLARYSTSGVTQMTVMRSCLAGSGCRPWWWCP